VPRAASRRPQRPGDFIIRNPVRVVQAVALCLLVAAGPAVAADPDPASITHLIVKFRDSAAKSAMAPSAKVAQLAAQAGVGLLHVREMALGAHVVAAGRAMSEPEALVLSAELARNPDVEYAQPDRRMKTHVVPNDAKQGFQEAYLGNAATAISAYAAWDTTKGSPSVVVAVLDTGVLPHEDLNGRLLPGYDFVSDLAHANDGNGRDPDPSDPGDWIDATDLAGAFKGTDCKADLSSWHGTSVSGVIASNSNNEIYGSGISWASKVLPVRVLGKCDGAESDAIDGLAWAGGLHVPGVPDNPSPAQVINMSFGGKGDCLAAYANTIAAVLAHGVTRAIVASAGNSGDDSPHAPSGCPGVLSVAATNLAGGRASYSSYGARIDLSAPGGTFAKNGTAIWVISNQGATVPTNDFFTSIQGTSFSAPMVSGVASLMLSVAPGLDTSQVRSILTATAKSFPADSDCNTSICGAGIVNADAAVKAALAAGGGPASVDVVEYYNAALDHYFITWIVNEIAILDAGTTIKGWTRTGYQFKAYPAAQGGTSPVCRYYIPPALGNSHFFGRGTVECNATGAKNPSFVLEEPNFMHLTLPSLGTCPAGTTQIYRVFSNRPDANHRYMTDKAVRAQMVAKGWLAEGDGPDLVVMCAPT
jgi:serine protease